MARRNGGRWLKGPKFRNGEIRIGGAVAFGAVLLLQAAAVTGAFLLPWVDRVVPWFENMGKNGGGGGGGGGSGPNV